MNLSNPPPSTIQTKAMHHRPVSAIVFISACIFLFCDNPRITKVLSEYQPQQGDILFQCLEHLPMVSMIKDLSQSQYIHCGIVARKNDHWIVLEPFPGVKETSLSEFIGRGKNSTVDAYRLNDEYAGLIPQLLDTVRTFLGRPYDFQFELDEKKVYCSELIYLSFNKVYHDTLGTLIPVKNMNWKPHEATIRLLAGKVPLYRLIITPQALSEAPQLHSVYRGLKTSPK